MDLIIQVIFKKRVTVYDIKNRLKRCRPSRPNLRQFFPLTRTRYKSRIEKLDPHLFCIRIDI
jgi:hypothetical protein